MAIVVQVTDSELLSRVPAVTFTLLAENEKPIVAVGDTHGCVTFAPVKADVTYSVRAEIVGGRTVDQQVILERHEKRLLKLVIVFSKGCGPTVTATRKNSRK